MNRQAKIYVSSVIVAGIALLAIAALRWETEDATRFLGVLLLAAAAATRKVRLPLTTSNISIGFLFILIGIAEFSFAETAVLACTTALVQSLWNMRRFRLVQIAFNVSALGLSAAAGYLAAHHILGASGLHSHTALMSLATMLFFVCDTGLVAGVLALTEGKSLDDVWKQCTLWAFPYYLVGAVIASGVSATSHSLGWVASMAVLPLMYLVYIYYRIYVERNTAHAVR